MQSSICLNEPNRQVVEVDEVWETLDATGDVSSRHNGSITILDENSVRTLDVEGDALPQKVSLFRRGIAVTSRLDTPSLIGSYNQGEYAWNLKALTKVAPITAHSPPGVVSSSSQVNVGVEGAEQLKMEVDYLLERRSALQRESKSLEEEIGIMLDQKCETRRELSELMSDLEAARSALESLHVDLVSEQEQFMTGHNEMLDRFDMDIEQRKSAAMAEVSCERRLLTEKQSAVENLMLEVNTRELDLVSKEKEVEERMRLLHEDIQTFNTQRKEYALSVSEREAAVAQRERECHKLWIKASEIIKREDQVSHKEQMVAKDEVTLQEGHIALEKAFRKLNDDACMMEKERLELVDQKRRLEISRKVQEEAMRREKEEVVSMKENILKNTSTNTFEEEHLDLTIAQRKELEEHLTDLLAKIEIAKSDLEITESRLQSETSELALIVKQKSAVEAEKVKLDERNALLADQIKKDWGELQEKQKEIEEEALMLKDAKIEVQGLSETMKQLVIEYKGRESALEQAELSIAPQLSDLSMKRCQFEEDSAGLQNLMENIEREAKDLEARLEVLIQREEACSKKEALLDDRQEAIDFRQDELESQISKLELQARDVQLQRESLETARFEFEALKRSKEAELDGVKDMILKDRIEIDRKIKFVEEETSILTRKSNVLKDDIAAFEAEKKRIEELHHESLAILQANKRMRNELETDREILSSRENRVKQMEKDSEALHNRLSQQNLEIASALEKACHRESVAALRCQEAEAKIQESLRMERESAEKISHWEKVASEAREKEEIALRSVADLKHDQLIVDESMALLKEYEKRLQEKDLKIRDTWNTVRKELLKLMKQEPDNSIEYIFAGASFQPPSNVACKDSSERSIFLSRKDFNHASIPEIYKSWNRAAKLETFLEQWSMQLALEASRQKAHAESLEKARQDFAEELDEAKSNRKTAEQLIKEIQVKEVELEDGIHDLELREKKLMDERAWLEDVRVSLEREQKDLESLSKDVDARSNSLKLLETSWKDRMAELRDREKSVSDLQRRLSHQRQAMEEREARLLEAEEHLRDDTVALSSKRSLLSSLEAQLASKEAELKEREADADALLAASRNEMTLASETSAKSHARLIEIEENALELESLSEEIDRRMQLLFTLEEKAKGEERKTYISDKKSDSH